MTYLPILIDVRNQDILVVGEGHLAARKVRAVLRAGAKVSFVGDADADGLAELLTGADCRHMAGSFSPDQLRGMRLVFAATADMELAKAVSRAAREASIPVNVADKTALCSFIMPATVKRGPIVVAVSSGGDAPILTRTLRGRLETTLPASLGTLAEFVSDRRGQVMERLSDFDSRRRFWDRFMDGPIPEQIETGDTAGAERLFGIILREAESSESTPSIGSVSIIGCGPGDPDLLTFKALRLMQQADFAALDADVSDDVAERVRRDAEIIRLGPSDTLIGLPTSIVARTAIWVREGRNVVRLGRGNFPASEQGLHEAAALVDDGIKPIIVNGVDATNA